MITLYCIISGQCWPTELFHGGIADFMNNYFTNIDMSILQIVSFQGNAGLLNFFLAVSRIPGNVTDKRILHFLLNDAFGVYKARNMDFEEKYFLNAIIHID